VRRDRRWGARPARPMICPTASRAWYPAVGPRLDRRVRPRPGTTAWTCEGRSFRFPLGALPPRGGDGGVARIRAAPTLDCSQTHQWQMDPTKPIEDDGLPRSAVFRCNTTVPSHRFRNLRQRCSDHEPSVLVLPISPDGAPAPRGVGRRPVSSESAAASWLFGSRRQALILLEHCTDSVARPNV